MKNIQKLVRKNILSLQPYSSARDEYQGEKAIFLDANENPYGTNNRYPDPYQNDLKATISNQRKVSPDKIFVGNGSDEAIDLLFRIFCEPGKDKALTFTPSYGMYKVSASINNVGLIELPLNKEFQIDRELLEPYLNDAQLKLIFLCSPNNPTGNVLEASTVEWILEMFQGVVVLDEAYIDFSSTSSFREKLDAYSNLVVLQTLSKAWGQAALRIGFAFSNPYIVRLFNKVKPPYNVSGPTQKMALEALQNTSNYKKEMEQILQNRDFLESELASIPMIKKIYPSEANFLLVKVENATTLYKALVDYKIVVRNRHKVLENHLRITVGSTEENLKLIQKLKQIAHEKSIVSR